MRTESIVDVPREAPLVPGPQREGGFLRELFRETISLVEEKRTLSVYFCSTTEFDAGATPPRRTHETEKVL